MYEMELNDNISDTVQSIPSLQAVSRRITHLVADQHMDARGTLFEDLIYLPGWNVEELSELLCQLSSCEVLQVNGMIY